MGAKLKRPETLEEGKEYLWQENTRSANGPSIQQVTFVSYHPCPAFVVVQDEEGKRWRCLREEIFTLETINQDRRFLALTTASAA